GPSGASLARSFSAGRATGAALTAAFGSRAYDRTVRTRVCRGTVSGSVAGHSTHSFSPNGNGSVRAVAPSFDSTSRPSTQLTCGRPAMSAIVFFVPRLVRALANE